jgi:DNA-3-methyladenine glycosylase II
MAYTPELSDKSSCTLRRIAWFLNIQLSGHVAGAIYNRFASLFGKGKFPTPEQIKEIDFEIMRGAGLSKSKTTYIKEVAEMALVGIVPSLKECDKLSDEEIKDRLIKNKGSRSLDC